MVIISKSKKSYKIKINYKKMDHYFIKKTRQLVFFVLYLNEAIQY